MTDELRWYLLSKKRTEAIMLSAFRGLRRHGIEPVLIKGWAAAQNYPDDRPRFFGDVDLAVSAADFDRARELTETADSGIKGVDLHRELRHLDLVDWETLIARSSTVSVAGEGIRILSPEDHLRVMCVHWLTDGGESKERLWDIYYAVQNRPASFDWDKCLNVVDATRRGWIVSTIGLAHRYLGLDIEELPFAQEARDLPAWLIRCVEKEWAEGVPLRPLQTTLSDLGSLVYQIRKRIRPNPIQATIDCGGPFDDSSRIGYQVKDIFIRLVPSVRRVTPVLLKRY